VARTNLSEEERAKLRRELAANGRWRGELTVARKDGTTVEAELIFVALWGEHRDTTGYQSRKLYGRFGREAIAAVRVAPPLSSTRACWSPADFSLGARSDERLTRPPQ
jgi:hypothetical protein